MWKLSNGEVFEKLCLAMRTIGKRWPGATLKIAGTEPLKFTLSGAKNCDGVTLVKESRHAQTIKA